MTRTFWLSFVGEEGSRGACVVDVTDDDVAATPPPPNPAPFARWLAAAIRLAWIRGCNPGGEVGMMELPPEIISRNLPRNRLLTGEELARWGEKRTKH